MNTLFFQIDEQTVRISTSRRKADLMAPILIDELGCDIKFDIKVNLYVRKVITAQLPHGVSLQDVLWSVFSTTGRFVNQEGRRAIISDYEEDCIII